MKELVGFLGRIERVKINRNFKAVTVKALVFCCGFSIFSSSVSTPRRVRMKDGFLVRDDYLMLYVVDFFFLLNFNIRLLYRS